MINPADLYLTIPPRVFFHENKPAVIRTSTKPIPDSSPLYWLTLLRVCQQRGFIDGRLSQFRVVGEPGNLFLKLRITEVGCRLPMFLYLNLDSMLVWSRLPEGYDFWCSLYNETVPVPDTRDLLYSMLLRSRTPWADFIMGQLDAFMSLLKKLELT